MNDKPTISREELVQGFAKGRSLIQEDWAHPLEIAWIDELVAEGKVEATKWRYDGELHCDARFVTGIVRREASH